MIFSWLFRKRDMYETNDQRVSLSNWSDVAFLYWFILFYPFLSHSLFISSFSTAN